MFGRESNPILYAQNARLITPASYTDSDDDRFTFRNRDQPVDPSIASGRHVGGRWSSAFQFTSGVGHRVKKKKNARSVYARSRKPGEFGTGPTAAFGFRSTPIGPAQPMGGARAAALRRHRSRRLVMHRLTVPTAAAAPPHRRVEGLDATAIVRK
ncbi:hypothetical protein MRX96_048891 [Rhipicephalus microplus]